MVVSHTDLACIASYSFRKHTSSTWLLGVFWQVLLHKLCLGLVDETLLVVIFCIQCVVCVSGANRCLMCDSVEDAEGEGAEAKDLKDWR